MKKHVVSAIAVIFMLLPNTGRAMELIDDYFYMTTAEHQALKTAFAFGALKTDPSLEQAYAQVPDPYQFVALMRILDNYVGGNWGDKFHVMAVAGDLGWWCERLGLDPKCDLTEIVQVFTSPSDVLPTLSDDILAVTIYSQYLRDLVAPDLAVAGFADFAYAFDPTIDDWCGTPPRPLKWPIGWPWPWPPRWPWPWPPWWDWNWNEWHQYIQWDDPIAYFEVNKWASIHYQIMGDFARLVHGNPEVLENLSPYLDFAVDLREMSGGWGGDEIVAVSARALRNNTLSNAVWQLAENPALRDAAFNESLDRMTAWVIFDNGSDEFYEALPLLARAGELLETGVLDFNFNETIPAFVLAMEEAGKDYNHLLIE